MKWRNLSVQSLLLISLLMVTVSVVAGRLRTVGDPYIQLSSTEDFYVTKPDGEDVYFPAGSYILARDYQFHLGDRTVTWTPYNDLFADGFEE